MPIFLRPYTRSDKPGMLRRAAAFFGRTGGDSLTRETLREWLKKPNKLYLIERDKIVVGFLCLGFRGSNVAWINYIYVDEALRGQGIATAAIYAAERLVLSRRGYDALCMDVDPRNAGALRLYHFYLRVAVGSDPYTGRTTMPSGDISFARDGAGFSYRVAGIVLRDGHVLLQNTERDPGYAFPGGSAAFGETNAETLAREFREELGAEIRVGALRWVEENFFCWNNTQYQQICLTYTVELAGEIEIPMEGRFRCLETRTDGNQVWFTWMPIERLRDRNITVYPHDAADLLARLDQGVRHIVRREQN